jgi:hypothetical protein
VPGVVRAGESFEYGLDLVGRNTGAVVGHGQPRDVRLDESYGLVLIEDDNDAGEAGDNGDGGKDGEDKD